jgi:predicted unusual protein kinase regulating ubiquinone biosynthesis (AarF/ABC1/UbiB family)
MSYFLYEYLHYILIHKNRKQFIQRFSQCLINQNVLFVKFFQSICINEKWVESSDFLFYSDHVPYQNEDIDFEYLQKCIDTYSISLPNGLIPYRSGMISLIYAGRMKNEEVILKMKRKNIEQKMNIAIKDILDLLSWFDYFFFFSKKWKSKEFIEKNKTLLKQQIDFPREVSNLLLFSENCQSIPFLKIPNVYQDVTIQFPDIIVMEKINGKSILELKKKDYYECAQKIIEFGFITTLIHGVVHGDLHPGNILFIQENSLAPIQLGILDYGIVHELSLEWKQYTFHLALEYFSMSNDELAQSILESNCFIDLSMISKLSKEEYNKLKSLLSLFIYEFKEHPEKMNLIYGFHCIQELLECFQKKISLKDDFLHLQMIISMTQGITLYLCQEKQIEIIHSTLKKIFLNYI